MTSLTFFIYVHRRNDTGEVFYVGKGTRTDRKLYERAQVVRKRNRLWAAVSAKAGYTVEVVADYFQEADAFAAERALIERYQRRSDGGTLCNLTMGGEGHAGHSPSAETRLKISAAHAGERHHNWGKKLSAETVRKKSASMAASPKNLRGKTLPDWWRARIAAGKIGAKNPMHGRTGAAHPNARRVRDRESGATYGSVLEAATATGHKMKTLYNWLSGHRPNPTTLEFT